MVVRAVVLGTAACSARHEHRGAVHFILSRLVMVLRRAHKRGSIALHRMRAITAHVRSIAVEAHRVGPTGWGHCQGVVATCGRSVEMRLHL